jgi:hypothetical protein
MKIIEINYDGLSPLGIYYRSLVSEDALDVIGPVFQPEQASRGNPSPSGDK